MKKVIGTTVILSLIYFFAVPVHSVGPYVPLEQLVAEAELIVGGEVIGLATIVGSRAIYTDVTVRIAHQLKGSLSESEVTFRSLGGQSGDLVFEPEGSVKYHIGEQLIVLLKRYDTRWRLSATAESSVIFGGSQRTIDQITAWVSGREYSPETRDSRATQQVPTIPSISAVKPRGAVGIDQYECIQIEGSEFGALSDGRIRFMGNYRTEGRERFFEFEAMRLDNNPGPPGTIHKWTSDTIVVRAGFWGTRISSGPVQVCNGPDVSDCSSNSSDILEVKYNRLRGKWDFATVREGIPYSIDVTNFSDWGSSEVDTSEARLAIQRAFNEWENVPDVDLSFAYEGYSTHGHNLYDGNNTISWESFVGSESLPLRATAIASISRTNEITTSVDIVFNTDDTFARDDTARIREVMVHEIGHLLGLGDLGGEEDIRSRRIMSKWAPFEFDFAGPDSDTIEGVQRIYGKWSGELTSELNKTVWTDTIRISSDVTVPSGFTLIIEPSTVVIADATAKLLVYGVLEAEGVTFTAAAAGQTWGGLVFYGDAVNHTTASVLTGCTIEDALYGVRLRTVGWTVGGSTVEGGQHLPPLRVRGFRRRDGA